MRDPNELWPGGLVLPSRIRTFDLRFEYTSFAPEHSRWTCIDANTYDGAPDAEAPCTFIGRGASEKEARMDLLEQFAEHDAPEHEPRARAGIVVHSSAFEPPTVVEALYQDPDEEP